MEPLVRYAMTPDGMRIAYTVSGSGPPLVLWNDSVVSHAQLEWGQPTIGRLNRRLASRTTLVRFDSRGTGLSTRTFPTVADELQVDLRTVIDRVGLDRFILAAIQVPSLAAIQFAAAHPERLSYLVLVNPCLRALDVQTTPQAQALLAAARSDFVLATEAIGMVAFGPSRAESKDYGAYVRECIGPGYFEIAPELRERDVSEEARAIRVPTLVVKLSGVQYITDQMSQEVAATIPDAEYMVVPGTWADAPEEVIDRILDRLAVPQIEPAIHTVAQSGAFRAVLFTDLVGHTEMMRRLDDERGREVLRDHERITRDVLANHDGLEVKTLGDGFMAAFVSVTKAVECAIALQRAFASHAETGREPLHVRVGINAGEPIEEDADLFGATVILASRITAEAGPGEIVVPDTVRGLLSGKGFIFGDRGTFVPRGWDESVRLWEVRWQT